MPPCFELGEPHCAQLSLFFVDSKSWRPHGRVARCYNQQQQWNLTNSSNSDLGTPTRTLFGPKTASWLVQSRDRMTYQSSLYGYRVSSPVTARVLTPHASTSCVTLAYPSNTVNCNHGPQRNAEPTAVELVT